MKGSGRLAVPRVMSGKEHELRAPDLEGSIVFERVVPGMPEFERTFRRIYRVVGRIPEGTVATYGQIAGIVGVGPRQVGQALKALPVDTKCPWHRVINARGTVSIRVGARKAYLVQQRLLKAEGVTFVKGKVDLDVYRWHADV